MIEALIEILVLERKFLSNLLGLLEEQYSLIMSKNVFELEAIVDKIRLANKDVAEQEVRRRKIIGSSSMKEFVENSNNIELETNYREIKKIIEIIKMQKDTNELLIKQQISFNAQILNLINPRREIKTYNSYGSLSR